MLAIIVNPDLVISMLSRHAQQGREGICPLSYCRQVRRRFVQIDCFYLIIAPDLIYLLNNKILLLDLVLLFDVLQTI